MKRALILFLLAFTIPCMISAQKAIAQIHSPASGPRLMIQDGIIEGENDSGLFIYKGIPYARPPVDELRWKPPQDPESWQGVKETKSFSAGCMQLPVFDDMNFRADGFSEDCLYLNVWTPTRDSGKKLPVLVYYYGGGFIAGDGSEPRYDGASMARNYGIVTVTVNYRLGVFGFFAHPELSEESPRQASGNYALLDQAKALQWVKSNIAAFGGDPNNITIAGESAGSVSVSAQMASPLSRDLIAGVIGESGSILGALSAVPLKQAEKTGAQFAEMVGAGSLEELRALPAETLLQATGKPRAPRFSPTVDGYFFPKPPIEIYAEGQQADVPLFLGWNSEEMSYQALMQGTKPTPENYQKKIKQLYDEHADRILELYPAATIEEVVKVATALAGDRFIAYSTWKWGNIHSKTSSSPVYRYYFTKARPPMISEQAGMIAQEKAKSKIPEPNGAVHSAEIEYLMGNLPSNNVYAWTEADYKVSNIFQHYAANFVEDQNPNGLGLPYWAPLHSQKQPKVMRIGLPTKLKEFGHRDRYLLLDQLQFGK